MEGKIFRFVLGIVIADSMFEARYDSLKVFDMNVIVSELGTGSSSFLGIHKHICYLLLYLWSQLHHNESLTFGLK